MNLQLKELIPQLFRLITDELGIDSTNRFTQIKADFEKAISVQCSSSKLLNFYVEDLLSLSQIEKGTFRKTVSRFNVREAIEEVMTIQRDKAESKNITMELQLVGFEESGDVVTDKMRLQQVVLSYQSNAIKFTPEGGRISIRVAMEQREAHKFLVVQVKDNGCGIS